MTTASAPIQYDRDSAVALGGPADSIWRRALRMGRVTIAGGILLLIVLTCLFTLPWTLSETGAFSYAKQYEDRVRLNPAWAPQEEPAAGASGGKATTTPAPSVATTTPSEGGRRDYAIGIFGYDVLGRSMLARCLLGGTISLAVGVAAAIIAVVLGVAVGLIAGYSGGWIDSTLMRIVDILYGLPYILLVILFKIGLEDQFANGNWVPALLFGAIAMGWLTLSIKIDTSQPDKVTRILAYCRSFLTIGIGVVLALATTAFWWKPLASKGSVSGPGASLIVMFLAIGLVSWLTMARVVRGQVLSIRSMPYIEACRSMGLPKLRIFAKHVLPNLVGPVTVYATLTIPSAILQESFLSFLGVGVRPPLPTWGSLASEGVTALSPVKVYWWMLLFPCLLLMFTLLCLNFVGDGLRDLFDPKREAAKL